MPIRPELIADRRRDGRETRCNDPPVCEDNIGKPAPPKRVITDDERLDLLACALDVEYYWYADEAQRRERAATANRRR